MQKIILILTSSILLFNGCNKRECLSKESYNGIYNALTCNYQKQIDKLEESISNEELVKSKQFMEYQELLAESSHREEELNRYKEKIETIENLIAEIKLNLKKLDTNKDTQPLLYKIRHQVISMRSKIEIQQPIFYQSDIRVAQENNRDYNKKYQKNSQTQKKIEKKLTKSIEKIIMSEKANHLTTEDKKELLLALQETKRYTNILK